MTETTIRRGIKPLLALLITGMALLMMGAVRPAQADDNWALSVNPFGLIPGGSTQDDQIYFTSHATWPGNQGVDPYTVTILVSFYDGATCVLQSLHTVHDYIGSAYSPDNPVYNAPFDGFGYAMSIFNGVSMTGFTWLYTLTDNLNDLDTQSTVSQISA